MKKSVWSSKYGANVRRRRESIDILHNLKILQKVDRTEKSKIQKVKFLIFQHQLYIRL